MRRDMDKQFAREMVARAALFQMMESQILDEGVIEECSSNGTLDTVCVMQTGEWFTEIFEEMGLSKSELSEFRYKLETELKND